MGAPLGGGEDREKNEYIGELIRMWDVKEGKVYILSSKFPACITRWTVMVFTEIGNTGEEPGLGRGEQEDNTPIIEC